MTIFAHYFLKEVFERIFENINKNELSNWRFSRNFDFKYIQVHSFWNNNQHVTKEFSQIFKNINSRDRRGWKLFFEFEKNVAYILTRKKIILENGALHQNFTMFTLKIQCYIKNNEINEN